jgi:predicted RNA-binding protein YlxR (DUF448 family)/ribosomal protein L7Ae-like RNA K-turn-binding protein
MSVSLGQSMPETNVRQEQHTGPGKAFVRHHAERTCIGCRAQRQGRDLLRFVCAPHGEVLLDASGHAPGRGVYVCCDVMCLQKALKPAKLALALKRPVVVPDLAVVYQAVRRLLYRRLGAYLGLGQKAGVVVSGYALLQRALAQARVVYVILAEDTATGRAEEYRSWCTQYHVPYVTLFTKEELGHIIGKPSRSALGLTEPRLVDSVCALLTALERLQMVSERV